VAAEDTVEGRNAVAELLASGRRVKKLYLLEGGRAGDILDGLRVQAISHGIVVEAVPKRVLDSLSERGAHQGVVATVEPFRYADLDAVLAASGTGPSLIVALDHVTDPQNLGAVIRTAEVAGASAVVIPKDRAAAMTPSALKAAAGAAEYLPVCREPNLVRALERCKQEGYWVVGASEKASEIAFDAPMEGRIVLVMGAEGEGLARLTERACDLLVRIPVRGRISSLNVSAATAVLAYEWVRRTPLE
jgi:23S rRNA (guanosine2251-2'-O)-methyltransferase